MRIIFLGTPDFAVASLRRLVEAGCEVVAVVTAPDRPAGRGRQLQASPVKQYAAAAGLPVLQPERLKSPDFLQKLKEYNPDLQIVVAFRMLPEAVWAMPPRGTFNLHASLLPDYRGAAPINWVLINGETRTGLTTFFLQHEIDTGPLLFQQQEPIGPDDTAGTLHDRLMHHGAELVLRTVRAIETGQYRPMPQPEAGSLHPAPKLSRETGRIDWARPARQVQNLIRGLSPVPGAYTLLQGVPLKVFRAELHAELAAEAAPGSFCTDGRSYLSFRCADGWLRLEDLQPENKKRMDVAAFLRGTKLPANGRMDT